MTARSTGGSTAARSRCFTISTEPQGAIVLVDFRGLTAEDFKAADRTGDGSSLPSSSTRFRHFDLADTDGDGVLTLEEVESTSTAAQSAPASPPPSSRRDAPKMASVIPIGHRDRHLPQRLGDGRRPVPAVLVPWRISCLGMA
jgi:hypothetical protein